MSPGAALNPRGSNLVCKPFACLDLRWAGIYTLSWRSWEGSWLLMTVTHMGTLLPYLIYSPPAPTRASLSQALLRGEPKHRCSLRPLKASGNLSRLSCCPQWAPRLVEGAREPVGKGGETYRARHQGGLSFGGREPQKLHSN